jgi:hypothetical protein
MSYEELDPTVRKAQKLKELRRARERVKRLEQDLRGEPVQPVAPPYVPEFLRMQKGAGWVAGPDSRPPVVPRRSRVIENFNDRSRPPVDLLAEPTP